MIVYLPEIQFGDNSGTQFVNHRFIYSAIHAPHAINYIMPTLWVLGQIAAQSPFMYLAIRIVSTVFGLDSLLYRCWRLCGRPANHYIVDTPNSRPIPVVHVYPLCETANITIASCRDYRRPQIWGEDPLYLWSLEEEFCEHGRGGGGRSVFCDYETLGKLLQMNSDKLIG